MGKDTPIKTLLCQAKQLSLQQLVAYHSVLLVYKCRQVGQPEYLHNRLFPVINENNRLRTAAQQDIRIDFDLSLSRSSFFYRASRIWNALSLEAKESLTVRRFKTLTKQWIKDNISATP